ncbi:MAG: DUF2793 domain-containing protein [Devosia sp.]
MSTTARLGLSLMAPQQSQRPIMYNEAMAALDQLVQPTVKSRTTTAPPGSPAEGDAYIVAPSATGAWATKDGKFACWLASAWSFRTPANGWLAYVTDTAELAVCQSGVWSSFVTNGGAGLAKLGINTTADLTNRLALAADASLFTHNGTGHQLKLNKATAGDTASLLYQDNFSGRAELGLTGDDAFHVKVSPNGSTWYEALTIAQGSGLVTLPIGQLAFPAVQNPSANVNTLDDYEEGTFTPAIAFGGAGVGVTYGSPTLGRYTKIGRTVSVAVNLVLTSKGSSTGTATLTGLPFAAANDSISVSAAIGYATGFAGVTGSVLATITANNSRFNILHSNNGAAAALSNSSFTNSSQLFLNAVYDV